MLPVKYRGSVKNVLGPVSIPMSGRSEPAYVFQFTDDFSVFDWGKMPDALSQKGLALNLMSAYFFELVERPEIWKEFSKSGEALDLRKGVSELIAPSLNESASLRSSLSAIFNEVGERLQREGLKTHYLGLIKDEDSATTIRLSECQELTRMLAVKPIDVVRPDESTVLGKSVMDYRGVRAAASSSASTLIPLEVIFRFGCPSGSSLLKRVEDNPDYWNTLPVPRSLSKTGVQAGAKWDFPVTELFTKLESKDRPITFTEALAISGLSGAQLQELLVQTLWLASLLRYRMKKIGLELADGKFEWGLDSTGRIFLVDAIGPDELRILKDDQPLSKEFLRNHYRKSSWYESVKHAQRQSEIRGLSDWKRLVLEPAPRLPSAQVELARQVYLVLANRICGHTWFSEAWSFEQLIEELKRQNLEASVPNAPVKEGKEGVSTTVNPLSSANRVSRAPGVSSGISSVAPAGGSP